MRSRAYGGTRALPPPRHPTRWILGVGGGFRGEENCRNVNRTVGEGVELNAFATLAEESTLLELSSEPSAYTLFERTPRTHSTLEHKRTLAIFNVDFGCGFFFCEDTHELSRSIESWPCRKLRSVVCVFVRGLKSASRVNHSRGVLETRSSCDWLGYFKASLRYMRNC